MPEATTETLKASRRVRRIDIRPELLVALFEKGRHHYHVEGLPVSAVFRWGGYHDATGQFFVIIEDASFDEVQEGDVIPSLDLFFRDLRTDEEFASRLD